MEEVIGIYQIRLGHRSKDNPDIYDPLSEERPFDKSKPIAALGLPATTYELLDALERAGLEVDSEDMYIEVNSALRPNDRDRTRPQISFPSPKIKSFRDLLILNAATDKVQEMDDTQVDALDGLCDMDWKRRKEKLPAARFYDFVCSVDCCRVIPSAKNDLDVGRYYLRNGLVPELKDAEESMLRLVDAKAVGSKAIAEDGGVFLPFQGGFVQLLGEIREASAELDLGFDPPDYAMRVYARCYEMGTRTVLDLPMEPEKLEQELAALKAPKPEALEYFCADCRIVALNDIVRYGLYGKHDKACADFEQLNEFAGKIQALSDEDAAAYKAAVTLRQPRNTDEAAEVLDELGTYAFLPDVRSGTDYGKKEIERILDEPDAAFVLPHLDPKGYGKDLLEYRGIYLTAFGAIERKDGLPIYSMEDQKKNEAPIRGGMEMM